MTLIVCPVTECEPTRLRARVAMARAGGADAVELRLDTMLAQGGDAAAIVAAIPTLDLPVIVTLRHASERGAWSGTPDERAAIYAQAEAAGAAFIDCELAHVAALPWRPSRGKTKLLLSAHDFTGVPSDAEARIAAMYAAGADIAKLAYHASDAHDMALAERLLRWERRPLIALAMGEHGVATRVLAKKWGAFATFARLDDDPGSAPGQPTLSELLRCYRCAQHSPTTRVYGVIGSPIAHSLSPLMHNAALAHAGLDAVYLRLRVEDVLAFWQACGHWFSGLSITIPHKQELLAQMDRLHPLASALGAMNTMARDADGRCEGLNTDAEAISNSLRAAGVDLCAARVLVLGAGGAGRAAVAACRASGAQVLVSNRTPQRAQELARELAVESIAWERLPEVAWTVLIQATSVGLNAPDDTPWPHRFPSAATVFDTVYAPLRTRLIREAEAAGCRIVLGDQMFLRQGAAQFQRWTGMPAPLQVMRHAILQGAF